MTLEGKKALITGASGGIGEAIATALAKAGANIAISGTREEKLKQVAANIGGDVKILPCNLTDLDAMAKYSAACSNAPAQRLHSRTSAHPMT